MITTAERVDAILYVLGLGNLLVAPIVFTRHPYAAVIDSTLSIVGMWLLPNRFSLIDLTDGWLVDWDKTHGRFGEWLRGLELNSINHGWLIVLKDEPGHFWDNVVNTVSWFPVIWDDRDWDHVYLWKLMREKLRRMRVHQIVCGISADSGKVADEIIIAEKILDRLIQDDYVAADYQEHEKKFGSPWGRLEKQPDGGSVLRSSHDTEEGADILRIADKECKLKQADMNLLGKHMAEHVFGWWD